MASGGCCRQKSAQYTDVVIVGNGPSAITLSYMLHGYRPYYNNNTHSNTFLMSKLQNSKASIVEQDLEYLSEGLEGRSPNPVALLWDALTHPDADFGAQCPSLLSWQYEKDKAIPHIVLGKTRPGGSWQRMEGHMQTISQNSWMELPDLPFRHWLAARQRKPDYKSSRATVRDVRDYYEEYVKIMDLEQHFKDFHIVTSIQKVFHLRNGADRENGEVELCCQNVQQNHHFIWEVRGYRVVSHQPSEQADKEMNRHMAADIDHDSKSASSEVLSETFSHLTVSVLREEFCYRTPNVILATGTYDVPNKLCIKGENLPTVIHSLCDFEKRLSEGNLSVTSAPICIVGAGLSAADAILMALEAGIPVVHVFRRAPNDPTLIFKKLPRSIYPEYHRIAKLMKGEVEHELYHVYPQHCVVEIGEQMIMLKPTSTSRSPSPLPDNSIISIEVSCTVVMIGSRPDLSFLPGEGRNLGVVPKWPIDSKHNPIDVDLFSYQSPHEHGLFAMGPLIGDNFVRFGIGGALGITNHLSRSIQEGNL